MPDPRQRGPMRIERGKNAVDRLQGVDAGLGHGRVRLLARDRHLQMQTAVVRGNDGVRESGRDRRIGLGQLLVEQPFRADNPSDLLVVGEVELECSTQPVAICHGGLERQKRPGVGGEVRFRHRHAAPIHDRSVRAVLDHRAIGVEAPTEARRHDIAVCVERDDRPVAEAMADDQVRDALHARRFHHGSRHVVRFDRQTQLLQQLPHAAGMGGAIAGRIVARHLHQLGQKCGLARKLAIDEFADGFGQGHEFSAKCRTVSRMTRAATSASSAVMISRGEWLTPPFPQRTNNMAVSVMPSNIMASWPAPLGR